MCHMETTHVTYTWRQHRTHGDDTHHLHAETTLVHTEMTRTHGDDTGHLHAEMTLVMLDHLCVRRVHEITVNFFPDFPWFRPGTVTLTRLFSAHCHREGHCAEHVEEETRVRRWHYGLTGAGRA